MLANDGQAGAVPAARLLQQREGDRQGSEMGVTVARVCGAGVGLVEPVAPGGDLAEKLASVGTEEERRCTQTQSPEAWSHPRSL